MSNVRIKTRAERLVAMGWANEKISTNLRVPLSTIKGWRNRYSNGKEKVQG